MRGSRRAPVDLARVEAHLGRVGADDARLRLGSVRAGLYEIVKIQAVVLLLNPITPHLAHTLRQALGHGETLVEDVAFPKADPAALEKDSLTLAVQVNGKLRGTIDVATSADKDSIVAQALADAGVQKFIAGQAVKKTIVVPGKIVNIVVG